LDKVSFQDGALVNKGDLLFTIDQRPYQAAYDAAKSQVDVAKSLLEFSKMQLDRADELAKTGNISTATVDDRRREYLSAQAQMQGAAAALRTASLNMEFTEIKAPLSGRIDRRLVSVGNLVQPDSTLLTTIVTRDPIDFYFDVDERRLLNFADTARTRGSDLQQGGGGVPVQVRISDSTQKPFSGKLDFAENRVDNESGTMRIRARFDNPNLVLQPGLFGRVQVEASNTYKAILVPDEAVGSDQNQRVVYIVGADGTVSTKPVRPGPRLYGYRAIREGMDGTETIVVNGLMRARPGSKITPQLIELPQSRDDIPPEAAGMELAQ
jgi:RND family efflux transporter MFP subunit